MTSSHNLALTQEPALTRLERFLQERRQAKPVEDLEQFERDIRAMCAEVEREAVADELARLDVDVPVIEIEGIPHRKVLRCEETYFGASGPIRVMRTLYSTRGDGERAVSPMELRAGIIEGRWTPLAAKQAAWVVAHLTPGEGEKLFKMLGAMTPSKSSLDRLPKQLSEQWELNRQSFEAELRRRDEVPERAVTVGVSLDGVMAPMKDGERRAKRDEAAANGKETRGPAGYNEVGCGTLSYYDRDGKLLSTTRMARMPEPKKATLKTMLRAELESGLQQAPGLRVVLLADGTKDNWTFLSNELDDLMTQYGVRRSRRVELVDFYHAAQQLHGALAAAYGDKTTECMARFEKLRHVLRHDKRGVEKVIRALRHLCSRFPRRGKLKQALGYFRRNRHRMKYALRAEQNLPIGSGIVEAACKTLVTQRMKRSGMRWRHDGGQAILTVRGLVQSKRFEAGWRLLAATYRSCVTLPENVVAFRPGVGV